MLSGRDPLAALKCLLWEQRVHHLALKNTGELLLFTERHNCRPGHWFNILGLYSDSAMDME